MLRWRIDPRWGSPSGKIAGTVYLGRRQILIDGKSYQAPLLLVRCAAGCAPMGELGYRNRDRLDLRFENLFEGTQSGVTVGSIRTTNTSGHVGVHWVKRDSKWRAQIAIDYRCIALGDFENFGEAWAAREAGPPQVFRDRSLSAGIQT